MVEVRQICVGWFATFLMVFVLPLEASAAALPSARDLYVGPGASNSIEIPIENTSTSSGSISISLMSAIFTEDTDQPQLEILHADISSWFSLSQASVNLVSGERSSVVLTVSPPSGAPAQVLAVALVATETLPGQISFSHGSATLIFLTVGNTIPNGHCVGLKKEDSSTATISIANAGSGILVANGQIVLRGPLGIRFAQTDINPLQHRILFNQTRSWSMNLPTVPWWAFGSLSFDIERENIATDSCMSIPAGHRWWPMILVLVLIGAGSAAMLRFKRS